MFHYLFIYIYQSDPCSWFLCTEAQFSIHGIINDKTKIWHILSTLDEETSTCASWVISTTKNDEKYVKFKVFLLKTSLSRWELTECILSIFELSDRKPSALVNYLPSTLSDYRPEILLQHVFLHALPSHVQHALASSDCTDLESLGELADQVMSHPHFQTLPIYTMHPQDDFPESPPDDSPGQDINASSAETPDMTCNLHATLTSCLPNSCLHLTGCATFTDGMALLPAPIVHLVLGVWKTPPSLQSWDGAECSGGQFYGPVAKQWQLWC